MAPMRIAYHHIADNYVALFTTFIPCGVGKIDILDGLLKNRSNRQRIPRNAATRRARRRRLSGSS